MYLLDAFLKKPNNESDALLARFKSPANKKMLLNQLQSSTDIIGEHISFDDIFNNYCVYLRDALNDGDILYAGDKINKLNIDFINYMHTLYHVEERQDHYTVSDGAEINTRHYDNKRNKSADDMLKDWYKTAAKKVSLREDHAGANGDHTWVMPGSKVHKEGFINSGIRGIIPQIDVYDYSNMNNSQADTYMQNPKLLAMNSGRIWEGEPGFGRDTDESNAKLYNRELYRKNERGQENGFRLGQIALHNRYVDKETLTSYEHEYALHKHDMSVLNEKVNSKNERLCKKKQQRENQKK